jgi:hypothetical protein
VRQFDIGFDSDESKKTGIIQGVREGGNAWEAGVRDGQRWAPMDVVWGDPGYLVELEIRDGQRTRRVKYYPASSGAIHAPQYAPASSRGAILKHSLHRHHDKACASRSLQPKPHILRNQLMDSAAAMPWRSTPTGLGLEWDVDF